MKSRFHVFLSIFALLAACTNRNSQIATPSPAPRGPEVRGVFAGTTPCNPQDPPLSQIPPGSKCEQVTWNIILYQDPESGVPATYSLKSAYGLPKQNSNDLANGGTPVSLEGTWTIATGTKSDPEGIVYQLHADDQTSLSLLSVGDNLLHILDREQALRVGDGAWSYTLNRIDDQLPVTGQTNSQPDLPTRPPPPPAPANSSVLGVFDGRTPCHSLVFEFTQIPPFAECLKIKWMLTLYQDKVTGAPGSYLFMGTSTYREGFWKIVHGPGKDPEAVVYQLGVEGGEPISFLKVDENHLFLMDRELKLLVGNAFFSYTLSRTE